MSLNIKKNYVLISPFDAPHFNLDIPKVKDAYQLSSVKFVLKSLYPGSDDSTLIDYSYIGNSIIGFAADKKKIENLRASNKTIISPFLLCTTNISDSIRLIVNDKWFELIHINNKKITTLITYKKSEIDELITKIKEIYNKTNNSKLFLYDFSEIQNFNLVNELNDHKIIILKQNTEDLIKQNSKTSTLFEPKKKKISLFNIICFLLCLVIFFSNIICAKQNKQLSNTNNEIKEQYKEFKNKLSEEIKVESTNDNNVTNIKYMYSLKTIFNEFNKSASLLRIESLSMTENTFRIEGISSSSLDVLESFSSSDIFSEVNLIQVTTQDSGTEKFIITGTLKNDEQRS